LVVLAAGIASRYGSMKQTQGFGPSGETIMEYSIYDAIEAGFEKVLFIIREDFADLFKSIVEPKLKGKIEIDYVYQKLSSFTNGRHINPERVKPWGTAHAILCCKGKIKEPFAVINADDFYGKDSFAKASAFLQNDCDSKTYSIIGYELAKTLSENGTVSRGVCEVDEKGNLTSINERTKIYGDGSKIVYEAADGKLVEVPVVSKVSMNFWCFDTSVFSYTEKLFKSFLAKNLEDPKSEFFIPIVADDFIQSGNGVVKMIPTSSQWFGVTYKEDAPTVQASLDKLVAAGEYPSSLW